MRKLHILYLLGQNLLLPLYLHIIIKYSPLHFPLNLICSPLSYKRRQIILILVLSLFIIDKVSFIQLLRIDLMLILSLQALEIALSHVRVEDILEKIILDFLGFFLDEVVEVDGFGFFGSGGALGVLAEEFVLGVFAEHLDEGFAGDAGCVFVDACDLF